MTKKARHDLSLPEPLLRMIEIRAGESGESKNQCIQKLIEKGLQYEKEHSPENMRNLAQPTVNLEPLQDQLRKVQEQLDSVLRNQNIADKNSESRHKARHEENKVITDAIISANNNIDTMHERTEHITKQICEYIPETLNTILHNTNYSYMISVEDMPLKNYSTKTAKRIEEEVGELNDKFKCPKLVQK